MDDIQYSASTFPALDSPRAAPACRRAIDQSNATSSNVPGQNLREDCRGPAEPFEPGAVRYIKLGENGKWATDALGEGIIPFGYRLVDHRVCVAGNWDEVQRQLVKMGRTPRGVSQGLRELKDFYSLPESTLWVTMADGHFWWAFAKGPVVEVDQGNSDGPARYRRTRAGWSKTGLTGDPLTVRSLSSALTSTASFRMTICAVKHEGYLLRRIRGEGDPLHAQATALWVEMRDIGLRMIRQLD